MNLKDFIKERKTRREINKLKCFSATIHFHILYYPTLVFKVDEKDTFFIFPGSPRKSVFKIRDYKRYVFKTLGYPYEINRSSANQILTKRDEEVTLTERELYNFIGNYNHFKRWLESNNLLNNNGNIKKNLWSGMSR